VQSDTHQKARTFSKQSYDSQDFILFQTRVDRADTFIEKPASSCYPLTVSDKIKTLDTLKEITGRARANGKSIVFTNGCFDLLHRGHVHMLREAKACGDLLIVGINSDRSVRMIKGSDRPVFSEADRTELIAALEMVDYIVLFDEPDPYKTIEALKPDVLVKGGDWSMDKIIGSDIVEREGGRVAVIPYLKGFSTTEIIERIRS
jgi:rfaE bifunctional protein nucleotidyltransferase chain/domain